MRRSAKVVRIGNVSIGGDNPILVQSMAKTDARNIKATVDEILRLEDIGCEIVRISVTSMEAAEAIKEIKPAIHIPLVADIHFDPRTAIESIKNGVDKIRLNPSSIKDEEYLKKIALLAKERKVAIRVGADSGTLKGEPSNVVGALVKSTMAEVDLLEAMDFSNIVISIKSWDPLLVVKANKEIAQLTNYPIHLGVDEAGSLEESLVKNTIALTKLLQEGIGDTIRLTITGDSALEVEAGFTILKNLGLRQKGIDVIMCQMCELTEIDVLSIAAKVKEAYKKVNYPLKVAVMGCAALGPGEARDADVGLAGGGKNGGIIFRKGGRPVRVFKESDPFLELKKEIDSYLEEQLKLS